MLTEELDSKKICLFCASDYHLEMILLPYIKDKINDSKFVIFTQNNLEETVKKVLRMTVEDIPREATYWSIRLMAQAAGITTWQVRQIWKAADLKPHRLKNFKISKDPHCAEKVIDIVGLYMNPPENAAVLSCPLMRKRRFRPWITPSPCCPCDQVRLHAEHMITNETGRTI